MILHMSDFHYTEANKAEAKNILDELSMFLLTNGYVGKIKYIVNNGDFIDQQKIASDKIGELRTSFPNFNTAVSDWEKKLKKAYPNHKDYKKQYYENYTLTCSSIIQQQGGDLLKTYNKKLSNACKSLFSIVKKDFTDFVKKLGVDSTNVIVACGNHDRTWIIGDDDIKCKTNKFTYNDRRYKLFSQFVTDCGFTYLGSEMSSHLTKDGLCFVGCDSVAPLKNSGKVCCFCKNISKDALLSASKDKTLFVTHKPMGDYCDEAHYNYSGDPTRKFNDLVFEHCRYILGGDKHGLSKESNAIVAGAPLRKKKNAKDERTLPIHYTIIDSNTWDITPITYSNNSWKLNNAPEILSKVFEVSKQYLLDNVKDSQIKNRFENANDLIDYLQGGIQEKLSTIFRAEGVYRIKGNPKNKEDLWQIEDLFEFLADQVRNATIANPFNIMGVHNAGKSTLLTQLYSHFLNSINEGELEIVPLYFNLRSVMTSDKHIDEKELLKHASDNFTAFIENANKLMTNLPNTGKDIKRLYLIDGLDEINLYGSSGLQLSACINNACLGIEKKGDLFVLSRNQFRKHSSCGKMDWYYDKTHSDVLYLDPVYLIPITDEEKEKRDEFFNAINSAFADLGLDVVYIDSLIKAGKVTATVGLVYWLFGNKDTRNMIQGKIDHADKWYQVIRYFNCVQRKVDWNTYKTDEKLKETAENLKKSAYDFISDDGYNYTKSKCSVKDFQMIVGNESVRNMLCAEYFVDLFDKGAIKEWQPFIPHSLALFICAALSNRYNTKSGDDMIRFVRMCEANAKDAESAQLLSVIAYIIGQVGTSEYDDDERVKIIEGIGKYEGSNKVSFESYCLARSQNIGAIYTNQKNTSKLEDLLSELLFKKSSRAFDRVFLLTYYGDTASNYSTLRKRISCEYSDGFDFDLSYRNLKSLLNNKRNPVYLYNAYMLASFVRSRLNIKSVTNAKKYDESFFFKSEYTLFDTARILAVLTETIKIAEGAFQRAETELSNHTIRMAYKASIKEMLQLFKACKRLYAKYASETMDVGTLHKKVALRAHPEYAFDKLRKLEYFGRSCWDFDQTPVDSDESKSKVSKNLKEYSKVRKETVLEHVYETMLIAFLYLPEISGKTEGYNKADVLSIILTHEFGTAECGDIPSSLSAYKEKKDDILYTKLYLALWCNMFNALNESHNMFDLSVKYENADSIEDKKTRVNAKIAKEIGDIQKEYKRGVLINSKTKSAEEMEWIPHINKANLEPLTSEIYEMLIENNPRFSNLNESAIVEE